MRTRITLFVTMLSLIGITIPAYADDETPVKSRIESVGLFKNGLSVVRRTVEVPKDGSYRIDDVPNPVHGTFWVESDRPVSVRVTSREVDAPPRAGGGIDFQTALVGREVTIHFRGEGIPVATGKVVEIARARGDQAWNRQYEQQQQRYYGYYGLPQPQPGQFIVLDNNGSRTYADTNLIAHLSVKGESQTVKQRLPVLLLDVEPGKADGQATEAKISISYLTKGLAWAPSYRVNLDDTKMLTIEQQAVIKNELSDIEEAEFRLISGFPSVQFAHVSSPLSLQTNWANFFTQLSQRPSAGSDANINVVRQQARIVDNSAGDPSVDLSASPEGEGVDLHYQAIGKRTMSEGDSLALSVASATADFERVVEWIVPDTRDANGRYIDEYRRQQDPEKYQDAAWDAVRFKNPLPFAMTTAPAMVWSGGRFNGQRMSYWVNTGEQTTLHVTKALSLRTRATEQEEANKERELVYVGGNDFRRVAVAGELSVNNHRKEPITLVIRRQFSGEMLKADGDPKVVFCEEGVYSVNRRNELTWTLVLQPGEEKALKYQYAVLVDN